MRAPSLTFREKGTKSYSRSSIRSVPVIPPEEDLPWDGLTPIYPTISNELWYRFTGAYKYVKTNIDGLNSGAETIPRTTHSLAITFRSKLIDDFPIFNAVFGESNTDYLELFYGEPISLATRQSMVGSPYGNYSYPEKFQLTINNKIYEGVDFPIDDNTWHTFIYTCDYNDSIEPVKFYLDGVKGELSVNGGALSIETDTWVIGWMNYVYMVINNQGDAEISFDVKDYILFDGILNLSDIEKYIRNDKENISTSKIMWHKLNENMPEFSPSAYYEGIVLDSSGNNNHLSLTTYEELSMVFAPHEKQIVLDEPYDGFFHFQGNVPGVVSDPLSSVMMLIPNTESAENSSPMSIAFHFQPSTSILTDQVDYMLQNGNHILYRNTSNKFVIKPYCTGGSGSLTSSVSVPYDGNWHSFIVTLTPSTGTMIVKMYLDGVEDISLSGTWVGEYLVKYSGFELFQCINNMELDTNVKNFMIFSSVMSPEDIQCFHDARYPLLGYSQDLDPITATKNVWFKMNEDISIYNPIPSFYVEDCIGGYNASVMNTQVSPDDIDIFFNRIQYPPES